MLRTLLSLFGAATLALAAARTSAPSGALVVGGSGQYKTIQAAVNALSTTSTAAQSIFINAGTYNEQVYIPTRKASLLSIYGYTTDDSSYANNQVTIQQGKSQADGLSNDGTATLRNWATNTKVYNINLINTKGQGSQALAVSANAGNQGYYACQFKGFQDTILAQTGAQVYAKCLIQGATDFIFGQHASAWITGSDIRVVKASLGYVVASGRAASSDSSWYVIDNCNIAAASGNSVPNGAFYLGRPWGAYARVTVQNTALSSVINAAGWSVWQASDTRTSNAQFQEIGNTGAGASGTRASFSKKASSAVAIGSILGSGYASASWVDSAYL